MQELAGRYQSPGPKLQIEVITAINDPEAPADKQKALAETAFAAFEEAAGGQQLRRSQATRQPCGRRVP